MNPARPSESEDFAAHPDASAAERAQSLLWLAESAPLTAAPADALLRVRERLHLALPRPSAPSRRWRVAALAGWGAAAAMLAAMIWQSTGPRKKPLPQDETVAVTTPQGTVKPAPPVPGPGQGEEPGMIAPITDTVELRRQIAELREALQSSGTSQPGTHRPVIQELHPPGSTAPAAGSERVLEIIASALEADLRRHSATANGEVIIESGWAKSLSGESVFRHRQFPKDNWAEMGLLAGPAGQFLDPATGWLWSPDPESTDYTGRAAPPDFDGTAFAAAPASPQRAPVQLAASGYVLSGTGGQTIVALSNLPAVPSGSTVSIASLSGTSFINGQLVRNPVSTGLRSFSIPTSAYSTDGTWNFSGILPNNVNLDGGYSLQVNSASGTSSTILSTGAGR